MEQKVPPYRPIKRRSDSKINKSLKRPFFDQVIDRMMEEPPARWNYF
jgi:hypothetical protein